MLRMNRRVDVSMDTKTPPMQGDATRYGEEGVAAPRYIPAWVFPQEDLDNLRVAGAGAATDITNIRGVPTDPTPDPALSIAKTDPASSLRSAFAETSLRLP